jgi:hypothetical protein
VKRLDLACDDSSGAAGLRRLQKLGMSVHVISLRSGLEGHTPPRYATHPTQPTRPRMDEHTVGEGKRLRRSAAMELCTRLAPAGAHLPATAARGGTTGGGEGCTGAVWRRAQATRDGDGRHLRCPAVPPAASIGRHRGSRRRAVHSAWRRDVGDSVEGPEAGGGLLSGPIVRRQAQRVACMRPRHASKTAGVLLGSSGARRLLDTLPNDLTPL